KKAQESKAQPGAKESVTDWEKLQADIKQSTAERDKLRAELKEREARLTKLDSAIDEKQARIAQLEAALNQNQAKLAQLEAELAKRIGPVPEPRVMAIMATVDKQIQLPFTLLSALASDTDSHVLNLELPPAKRYRLGLASLDADAEGRFLLEPQAEPDG